MLESGGIAGIRSRFNRAVRGVLETDRHGQTARQFAVHLAFRVAGADCAPTDEVAQVLRGDRVKPFGGSRQAETQHIGQDFARQPHAFADIEPAIQIGVVNQTFPADGRARLFEIYAHDDEQTVAQLAVDGGKLGRVFVGRFGVVDRAGADKHEQTVVTTVHDIADFLTRTQHQITRIVGQRQLTQEGARRGNRVKLAYVDVHSLGEYGSIAESALILSTIGTTQTSHHSLLSTFRTWTTHPIARRGASPSGDCMLKRKPPADATGVSASAGGNVR